MYGFLLQKAVKGLPLVYATVLYAYSYALPHKHLLIKEFPRLLVMLVVALLVLFFSGTEVHSEATECLLKVAKKSDFAIYRKLQWIKPNTSVASDVISTGDLVEVRCETGFLQNHLISKAYNLQCTNGSFNHSLRYDDFLCRSKYKSNTTTYIRPCCDQYFGILKCIGKNLMAYEIGHLQPSGCAKILYAVCVDKTDLRTKFGYQSWVKPPNRKSPKSGCKKGIWGFDEFGESVEEKKTLSKAYYQKYQKQRLSSLFPGKYNRKKPYPYYFNRGHIVPSGDFEECEQSSTYEHINLAPQWQVLNGGSWNTIEEETRDLIRNSNRDWVIYTGTYGKIPTPRGLMYLIPIFEKGKFKKGYIPVPMMYWKIVFNKCDRAKSVVYVGVNNPEFKSFQEIPPKYFLCNPLRNKYNQSFIGSEFKGFVYRCNLDEFLSSLSAENIVV